MCRNIIAHLPCGFNRVFEKNADELKVENERLKGMVSPSGMNKRLEFDEFSTHAVILSIASAVSDSMTAGGSHSAEKMHSAKSKDLRIYPLHGRD